MMVGGFDTGVALVLRTTAGRELDLTDETSGSDSETACCCSTLILGLVNT